MSDFYCLRCSNNRLRYQYDELKWHYKNFHSDISNYLFHNDIHRNVIQIIQKNDNYNQLGKSEEILKQVKNHDITSIIMKYANYDVLRIKSDMKDEENNLNFKKGLLQLCKRTKSNYV